MAWGTNNWGSANWGEVALVESIEPCQLATLDALIELPPDYSVPIGAPRLAVAVPAKVSSEHKALLLAVRKGRIPTRLWRRPCGGGGLR
jgi:hypothetical protein